MKTNPERPPVRVGLLMDSHEQPAWAVRMLERIREEGNAEIVLLVLNDGEAESHSGRRGILGKLQAYWRNRGQFWYLVYQRLDRRRAVPGPDPFEPTDTTDLLNGIPSITVSPRRTKFSDYFSDEDVAAVEDHNLDVLIRLGFRILRGGILNAAHLGVWSFHHGDNRVNRGGPAGFWEVLLQWPVTGSILQILEEDLDNGIVLDRSWSATESVSVRANKAKFYWKSLSMIPRQLAHLHRVGRDAFLETHRQAQDVASFYSQRLFVAPTNKELFWPFVRLHGRLIRNRFQRGRGQWQLRYAMVDGLGTSLWRMKSITPPDDRFWADPHVIRRDDLYYVFFEDFPFSTRKGIISVLTIDDDGKVSDPTVVLERPYHLSYPFVFEFEGEVYMIPETSGAKTIELYKCDEFPHKWTLERVLMDDIFTVDTTLLEHEGRWWMFTNIRENEGATNDEELFVFHTDDPIRGEWTAHLQNPVVSDVRRARPAGAFVRDDQGRLIRPAQDCSIRYGWAMRLHQITKLTPEEFEEVEVRFIKPDFSPDINSVHTLAHVDRLTMVDVNVIR